MIGTTIGPYRVLRELGQGGMGTVVLAEDTRLGRHVALKTVSGAQAGTSGSRAQLLDEARAAAALTHPAIAAVHDVIEHDGNIAIVFELVEGETLAARLAKGPLPEEQAVAIAVQIADALAVAHGARVLHRDLKPANIMLAPGGIVKILDFGIARFRPVGHSVPAGKDGDEGFMGTPGYVPPEQWTGRAVDERADLYALGVVLFEMLTGKRPFPEREPITLAFAAIDRIARRVSSLRPGVTPALDKLVARLLAADPSLRPPRARVVADELRQLQAPPPPAPLPWRRWAAVAAALFAIAGAVGWWLTRPVVLDVTNPVIAVLPFNNATGDSANDYLAAGVAESLSTSLASLPTVTVLARTVVDESRTRRKVPAEVAADLNASFAVDGRIERSGNQLRIAIALLRPDGTSAWSEGVEGPATGVYDMQARLATALGTALQVQLSPELRARLATRPTASDEALDAYWRGRSLQERRDTPGNLQRATVAFSEALRLDARFVAARVALGETYWELYNTSRDAQWVEPAIQASAGAVALAPDDPAVRMAYGVTLINSGRNQEAVQELQRAVAQQPNNDEARRYLAGALSALGRIDEAVAEWRKALAIRPNNWQALSNMGLALYQAARYDEAERVYEQLTTLQPDNYVGFQMLGAVYQIRSDPRALAFYERALQLSPTAGQALSNIGALYYEAGQFDKAVDAFRRAIAQRPNSAPTHRNLGDALMRLGRRDEAIVAYLRAVELAEQRRDVNPVDALNLASLAVYLEKTGQHEEALLRLEESIRLASSDPDVWNRAAQTHAMAGRTDAAVLALTRALDLGYSRSNAMKADEFASLRGDPRFRALIGS